MYEHSYIKFEYLGMKTVGVKDYTNQKLSKHFTDVPCQWRSRAAKKCLGSIPVKMRKFLSNVPKIGGAHLQCVNNHYTKFEYKGIKTLGVTDYTNQTPSKHFWMEK